MSSTSTLLGAAGEHFVVSELLRRDFIAALAPQGVPNMDIVVANLNGENLCAIQVKSRLEKGSDGGWHMRPKHEELTSSSLFYCFVDFGRAPSDNPEVFIIPSGIVANAIAQSHGTWLSNPGKNGRRRKDSSVRRLMPDYTKTCSPTATRYSAGWMEEYRKAWHLLEL